MKHIHQDGVPDVEPHSPKLRFISPQHTTKDVFRPSRYKAGIKCEQVGCSPAHRDLPTTISQRGLTVRFSRRAELALGNDRDWELRAAMSMARLWRDEGKREEARELLAPVYGWFTEGFDTRDLKEAKGVA